MTAFFDTNIWTYTVNPDRRTARAETLASTRGVVSVQVLNEFVSIARSKVRLPWAEVTQALHYIVQLCPEPVPLTPPLHLDAMVIAERSDYRIFDSLIIAAALRANCDTLYSEDIQDARVIEGRLTIRNPFAGP